jgi:hypothetical protein
MDAELDYDLTRDQWEVLKALRMPAAECRRLDRPALKHLIELGLADIVDDRPVISAKGRSVLLRGSPRLWDVAA